MVARSQVEIISDLTQSADNLRRTREAAEALKQAQGVQEATEAPRVIGVTAPPPSPITQRPR